MGPELSFIDFSVSSQSWTRFLILLKALGSGKCFPHRGPSYHQGPAGWCATAMHRVGGSSGKWAGVWS